MVDNPQVLVWWSPGEPDDDLHGWTGRAFRLWRGENDMNEIQTKTFATADVLSAVTGKLVSRMGLVEFVEDDSR